MLSKKNTIQKSFRVETDMENDLDLLAHKLNRSQNDLVNIALNQFMLDNIGWFVEDYLLDLCSSFLERELSEIEVSINELQLHLVDNGETIQMSYDIETKGFTEHCEGSILPRDNMGYSMLINDLKQIALKLGTDSPDIQKYMHERFSYIYSRESATAKFDRQKFIRQSIGLELEDSTYKGLVRFTVPLK